MCVKVFQLYQVKHLLHILTIYIVPIKWDTGQRKTCTPASTHPHNGDYTGEVCEDPGADTPLPADYVCSGKDNKELGAKQHEREREMGKEGTSMSSPPESLPN